MIHLVSYTICIFPVFIRKKTNWTELEWISLFVSLSSKSEEIKCTLFVNLTQLLLQLSPRLYQEDNSDMFYINVTVFLVNPLLVSCLLNYPSTYVPRNCDVVKIGHAWSFHLWIYWSTQRSNFCSCPLDRIGRITLICFTIILSWSSMKQLKTFIWKSALSHIEVCM